MNSEDVEIIHRIRQGDTDAYSVLVHKYHRHLLNFIFHIMRDESVVEDIGQEVLLSAYRALSGFDPSRGVPFSAWLFIIARNRCISELRKKKTADFIPILDDYPESAHLSMPDAILLKKEQKTNLVGALEKLEEPFKEAILKSMEGASIQEIARDCKVPGNTVKSRLSRAREKLRVLLKSFT